RRQPTCRDCHSCIPLAIPVVNIEAHGGEVVPDISRSKAGRWDRVGDRVVFPQMTGDGLWYRAKSGSREHAEVAGTIDCKPVELTAYQLGDPPGPRQHGALLPGWNPTKRGKDILTAMNRPARFVFLSLLLASCATPRPVTAPAPAKATAPAAPHAEGPIRESDEYTRYELLAPESASFHILFEVTAVTPGATVYFNPIRKGRTASGETVTDRASSRPLQFEVVSGAEARTSGLPEADLATDYIRVHLPRPVPADGGVRLLIEKTYADAKSYFRKGADRIVFTRTLGIRRNSIVLPAGYEPVACNAPAQMLSELDGRVTVSFMHPGPEAFPLTIE